MWAMPWAMPRALPCGPHQRQKSPNRRKPRLVPKGCLLKAFRRPQDVDCTGRWCYLVKAGGAGTDVYLFGSEVPNKAAADENIVLAALSRVHIQIRHPRPEVSSLTPQTESTEDLHIESDACLEYACGCPGIARVQSSKLKRGTLAEMAESATKTHPRRNSLFRKQIQSCCGRDENR